MTNNLFLFLAAYAAAGTFAKWIIDYRLPPPSKYSIHDTMGEIVWDGEWFFYVFFMLMWPVSLPVMVLIVAIERGWINDAFSGVGEAVMSWIQIPDFSITRAYEQIYQKLIDDLS